MTSTSRMWWPGSVPGVAVHGIALVALALADAARLLLREAQARDLDLRQRDGDDMLTLLADELALGEVLAEVLLDDAAHDLAEALHVALDAAEHDRHRGATLHRG